MTVARAPYAHSFYFQNAIHTFQGPRDLLLQALRRRVQQGVERASSELRPDPQDHCRDGETRERVRIDQPRKTPNLAGPNEPDSNNDYGRAPNVGRKMQRVRLQRLARILPGGMAKC